MAPFRRLKRGRKPTGLGKYGGVRWTGYSRRSTSAKRSAKLRRARAKKRTATRGFVKKAINFTAKNKKNHTCVTTHNYRLDQDLSFRNAYFPLGTNGQSSVTDDPGVGRGAALPWREYCRYLAIRGVDLATAGSAGDTAHELFRTPYKQIVGKGLILHRISIKGHCYIQPAEWMNMSGDNYIPYIDVYIFMVVDRAQKNAPMGYAANHALQNTRHKIDDFIMDKSQVWDNQDGYDKDATTFKDFNGHYMQTLMPINTRRYKVLKMTKFRMNPGQVIKAGATSYSSNLSVAGTSGEFTYSFPGRPSYANSSGFDQPFEMTLKFKRKKLNYMHAYRAARATDGAFNPNTQYYGGGIFGNQNNAGGGTANHYNEKGKSNAGVDTPINEGTNFFNHNTSQHNNALDAPSNFNPMLVACYSRPAARPGGETALSEDGASGMCKLEYTSEVTYENPLYD